jgi:hypothetical protein
VLAQDPGGRRPWAALRAADASSSVAAAEQVLDAVLPAAARAASPHGPAFEPHWRSQQAGWTPDGGTGAPTPAQAGDRRTPWWVAAAVVAALVMLLAGVFGWRILLLQDRDGLTASRAPAPLGTPAPSPQAPLPDVVPPGDASPSAPSPGAPGAPGPTPSGRPLETAGPGVAGPSFTPDEDTREMRLEGLPFAFRVPATWGCLRSDRAREPAVRWICIDDRWVTEDRDGVPPGGIVEVAPCPTTCTDAEWEALRDAHAPLAAWRAVDAQTAVAEDSPQDRPGAYRIRMSRVFSATGDPDPDTHVYVEMTGDPDQVEALQKVVNDIRANTD